MNHNSLHIILANGNNHTFDYATREWSFRKPIESQSHGQLNPNPGQLSQEISRVKAKPSRRKEKANQKLIAYFVKINEQHLTGNNEG